MCSVWALRWCVVTDWAGCWANSVEGRPCCRIGLDRSSFAKLLLGSCVYLFCLQSTILLHSWGKQSRKITKTCQEIARAGAVLRYHVYDRVIICDAVS